MGGEFEKAPWEGELDCGSEAKLSYLPMFDGDSKAIRPHFKHVNWTAISPASAAANERVTRRLLFLGTSRVAEPISRHAKQYSSTVTVRRPIGSSVNEFSGCRLSWRIQ